MATVVARVGDALAAGVARLCRPLADAVATCSCCDGRGPVGAWCSLSLLLDSLLLRASLQSLLMGASLRSERDDRLRRRGRGGVRRLDPHGHLVGVGPSLQRHVAVRAAAREPPVNRCRWYIAIIRTLVSDYPYACFRLSVPLFRLSVHLFPIHIIRTLVSDHSCRWLLSYLSIPPFLLSIVCKHTSRARHRLAAGCSCTRRCESGCSPICSSASRR